MSFITHFFDRRHHQYLLADCGCKVEPSLHTASRSLSPRAYVVSSVLPYMVAI